MTQWPMAEGRPGHVGLRLGTAPWMKGIAWERSTDLAVDKKHCQRERRAGPGVIKGFLRVLTDPSHCYKPSCNWCHIATGQISLRPGLGGAVGREVSARCTLEHPWRAGHG
jgi:hypothetical protein